MGLRAHVKYDQPGGRTMKIQLDARFSKRASTPAVIAALGLLLAASAPAAADEESLEEVTVTGSRIARDPNLSSALPVQSLSAEEIQLSGEFSIADVVNDIPALLSSTTSETSIDSGFSDGANILNLRGLGANRTLVLVDGRRHVAGVQGSGAVDVGSIPTRLIERVEVLTGGASAIYGADAVTGVVNFIMKDDYEGLNFDASYGLSADGDGNQTTLTATWGKNFADDRGNIAISVDYRKDDGVTMGDRPGELYGTGGDWVNPALRFQQGDIGVNTPLFQQYYNYDNTGLYSSGLQIPSAADFVVDYNAAFGTAITLGDLSAAEQALIDRGATAPQRAVFPDLTFPITSAWGLVAAGEGFNFGGFDPDLPTDLDNNGVPDCQQSFTGYNSTFAPGAFGAVGGCWNVSADGTYTPAYDGLVSGDFTGFGGSSFDVYRQDGYAVLLPDDKVSVNLMGHYDISDRMTVFGEVKFVTQETEQFLGVNSAWDLILGAPDNPFLPPFLQAIAAQTGGVSITIDPLGFGSKLKTERETMRYVAGLEGTFDNGWRYEVSANYGRMEQNIARSNQIIVDRWFAALDAVADPGTGQAACRSSVDPNAPPGTTPFNFPSFQAGYWSFTPGDGQCAPLDIWNGQGGITQAAMDFMTVDEWDKLVLDQLVISAFVTGDTAEWFELPAGPVSFAFGAEYRDESSDATFDAWQRGVFPSGSPFPAGDLIEDYGENSSLTIRPQITIKDEFGSYDASDLYLEVSLPLLADMPGAQELTLDMAIRQSDYSTIGQTTTWKTNLLWTPMDSLSIRGTFSEAVRAPNITELFGPQIGAGFRPDDPCDVAQINAIGNDNPTLAAQIQANCETEFATIGLDPTLGTGAYAYVDPLSAFFGGVTGGNPNLQEETAETLTVGFVLQPEFLPGFSLTVDYWDISIDDAIQAVSDQNIVDGCYQGPSLNPTFCPLFTRNDDPNSLQFGGLNFLRQSTINFVKVETNGIDFVAKYAFEVGGHGFDVAVQGTKVDEINNFDNPLDPGFINPELLELNRPELAGNVFLNWSWGDLQVGWQSQFIGEMLFGGIEVQVAESLYGPTVFQDELWLHDINARYLVNDEIMIYGGVKNITDERPFMTEFAFPASPRGTFFFVGLEYTM
jgi:iron complex outermembrane recepter protein